MKTTIFYLSASYLLCLGLASSATLVTYDRIEAGAANTFGYLSTTSGLFAVGNFNTVGREGASAIGFGNTVGGQYGLAVGTFNTVGDANAIPSGSMAVGGSNTVLADNSLVLGYTNLSGHWQFSGGSASFITGAYNQNLGNYSLLAGFNNAIPLVEQGQNVHVVENAALLGKGLIVRHDNCTVVGKNNASPVPTIPPSGPSPLFVVGKGSDASNRSNALEVLDNGQIIISVPQGDISMGIYE
jgi:hypothetical protein